MTERVLKWGRTQDSTRVHLVINGVRQCFTGLSRGNARPIIQEFPDWDIHDPDTCKICRERYYWLNKGAIPAKPVKPVRAAKPR